MNQKIVTLLLNSLHQDPGRLTPTELAALSEAEWTELLALAADQRVRPLLAHRLRQKGLIEVVPPAIWERLDASLRRNTMRNLRILSEYRQIAGALQAAGIPVIVLKGLHLATIVYEAIGLREMNDIDLMVPRQHVAQAAAILPAFGYQPLKPYDLESNLALSQHLTRYVKPNVLAVEIHWHITRPGLHYSIERSELWQRAQPVRIGDVDVLGLSPEDLILHLGLHTSYQHRFEFGLRPFCDLAASIRRFEDVLDWDALTERARRWGWQRGIALAFDLAQDLVGANIPNRVLSHLLPAGRDASIFALAREQIFTPRSVTRGLSPSVARVKALKESPLGMFRYVLHLMFPPSVVLSNAYGVPSRSRRLLFCYPRRWWDLVRRHGHTVWRIFHEDAVVTPLAWRKNMLTNWLELE